jgi:hypothetical protein
MVGTDIIDPEWIAVLIDADIPLEGQRGSGRKAFGIYTRNTVGLVRPKASSHIAEREGAQGLMVKTTTEDVLEASGSTLTFGDRKPEAARSHVAEGATLAKARYCFADRCVVDPDQMLIAVRPHLADINI